MRQTALSWQYQSGAFVAGRPPPRYTGALIRRRLRQRFFSDGLAGEPSLPAGQIPACAGMTDLGAGMPGLGAGIGQKLNHLIGNAAGGRRRRCA